MIYQCSKCGLSKSDGAMGSVLPQCKCDWAPPAAQRQWVELTDEEIEIIDDSMCGEREFAVLFARFIEAKLKEKNT
jgi:hypothetical protein